MFDIIIRYSVAQWAKGREKENKKQNESYHKNGSRKMQTFHQLRYPAC